jgi:diguanylate cyclase (GGDEF)-like protein
MSPDATPASHEFIDLATPPPQDQFELDMSRLRRLTRWLASALRSRSSGFLFFGGLSCVLAVGLADYTQRPEFSFVLFYMFPIVVVTWFGNRTMGLVLAAVSPVLGLIADLSGRVHPFSSLPLDIWNALVRLGTYALVVVILARLKTALMHERALARADSLTGVATPRWFYSMAEQELYRARRSPEVISVAYVDLDDFKLVNDQRGHAAGDELLREVATCLRDNLRPIDTVGRLGGDEFGILLPQTDAPAAAAALRRVVDLTRERLEARFDPTEGESLGISVGIASFSEAPESVDEMVSKADEVMYSVKRGGKDAISVRVFGQADREDSAPRLA